jgi:serine/threonine-protein kinase
VGGGASGCESCGTGSGGGDATSTDQLDQIRARLQASIGEGYELLDLLGRGGMGIVFRAREIALDREVALKVLALDPVLAPDAYARFEREAKLAARLDHPNIVPIFSVGSGAGVAYYTMRLVRGGSVEELLTQSPVLDLHRATGILREVAAALDYAHGRSVVHRDIKPGNILMGDTGHASVADFGIARALGQPGEATGTAIIGSPAYMSPEQWGGDELDGRADQYALAVVAFEMLAGRRPFDSPRVQDLLDMHSAGVIPDLATVRPGADPSAAAAIRRALAKHPSERFPNATAFVDALAGRRLTAAVQRTSRPIAVRQPKKRRIGLALVTLAALGVGVAFAVPQTRPRAMEMWAIAREQGIAAGRILASRAGIFLPPDPAIASAVDSSAPGLNIDSLERVIAALPDESRSADSGLVAGDSARLPLLDSLSRAPLATESPEARRSYQRVTGPEPGFVKVTYAGGIAKVRVDGITYGFTPQVIRVDPGPRFISLIGNAYTPLQYVLDVQSGDTAVAAFKVPAAAQPEAAAPSLPPAAPPAVAPPPTEPASEV